MRSQPNPFKTLAASLGKLSRTLETTIHEREDQIEVTRYNGNYSDFYGDPITIEVLYNDDDDLGTATIVHNARRIVVKFKAGGGGIMQYKMVKGSELDLLEVMFALASQQEKA